ncbi:MAG: hypothetical protein V4611_03475 [Patescibacteria group bacterium]
MDRNHKLDAPNNEELRIIDQIEDKSGAATVYRNPKPQFHGEILSAEQRQKVKDDELASITNDLWKSSLKIGLYVPYPFVGGALLAAILNSSVDMVSAGIMIGLLIVVTGFWLYTSYVAYARIFKIFYKHALRAGPFIFVMLPSVLLASQAFYAYTAANIAGQSIVFNVAAVSLLVVLYSILTTFIVLLVWSHSKIKGIFKAAVAGLVLLFSVGLVLSSYLL